MTISSTSPKSPKNHDFLDLIYAEIESDNDGNFIINNNEFCYTNNVIEYIAGFVARKLKKKMMCVECVAVIISSDVNDQSSKSLLSIQNKSNLTKPSNNLVEVCEIAESTFKSNLGKISQQPNIVQYLVIK